MDKCKKCAWYQIKDAQIYCGHIRDNGLVCDRFISLCDIAERKEDGTFECPQCKRNRDPGKCWFCELEDE